MKVVVVGSGPNGLAAAITLARAGAEVVVLEAEAVPGGGVRTLDLHLAEGLRHDLCSAVHPLAWASPFFAEFDLPARGVQLLAPEVSFAHPLDGGRAAVAYRDLSETAAGLGPSGRAWMRLFAPLVERWPLLVGNLLSDMRRLHGPLRPGTLATLARFGIGAVRQGGVLPALREEAAALFGGVAAHSMGRLPSLPAAGVGLMLATLGHTPGGWPIPHGGSGTIVAAMIWDLETHGGRLFTETRVETHRDLPPADAYVFDTTPSHVARVFEDQLRPRSRRRLLAFRHGAGVAKVDFVLSGPVPWTHADVARAGTVHVAGTPAQMAAAEADVARGRHAERPVCLVSDPAVADPSRAVGGLRPLWSYAHVPAGSPGDVTADVTAQIERFAPGFRDVVLASRCIPAAQMAQHNANYVGGDIAGGAMSLRQVAARPAASWDPYAVSGLDGVYLCSASTPPGPGVHGMGGLGAARSLLRRFSQRVPDLSPDQREAAIRGRGL
ncbi:MAG: phytoene dehydrogenase [Cellulomonas sp. 73-145]|uniref:phytoene desaturase family protein n=1 Tax=Cellulomonas sp. 73-145 TaxID=1895739 RepID=UPI0009285035|nr:NAD(P)/FAD-dependent oxidoreductase [Cellulomonas sp. 73-145]OJV61001.1 MAG: phytoene dehydrogenase [Cellulomonas sp. 73-145]